MIVISIFIMVSRMLYCCYCCCCCFFCDRGEGRGFRVSYYFSSQGPRCHVPGRGCPSIAAVGRSDLFAPNASCGFCEFLPNFGSKYSFLVLVTIDVSRRFFLPFWLVFGWKTHPLIQGGGWGAGGSEKISTLISSLISTLIRKVWGWIHAFHENDSWW